MSSCSLTLIALFQQNGRMSLASSATKTTHEKQLMRLVRKHKLLRARDLAEQGLPTIGLTRLVQAGKLDRVARGLYALPGAAMSEHRSLAEVALRVPRGVVCLLSALQFHEIGTQAPFEVWLAIPNRVTAPRIEHPAIRVVRMSDDALTEGLQRKRIDGVEVSIFNPARSVVDCFKFRNKIGLDVALEALREGWRERRFTMDELWHHATLQRVANVMRPYIEAITADDSKVGFHPARRLAQGGVSSAESSEPIDPSELGRPWPAARRRPPNAGRPSLALWGPLERRVNSICSVELENCLQQASNRLACCVCGGRVVACVGIAFHTLVLISERPTGGGIDEPTGFVLADSAIANRLRVLRNDRGFTQREDCRRRELHLGRG